MGSGKFAKCVQVQKARMHADGSFTLESSQVLYLLLPENVMSVPMYTWVTRVMWVWVRWSSGEPPVTYG